MFKQLAIVLFTGFVTLLPGGQSPELHAQGKPSSPLYTVVFLKPGETQQLVLSAPEFRIGSGDRTTYEFTPINESGDKTAALKGVAIAEDYPQMRALLNRYGKRFVAVNFAASADAEPGKFLIRVQPHAFASTVDYETTVRLIITK